MANIKFDVEKFKKEFYKNDKIIENAEKPRGRPLSDFFDHYIDNIHPKIKGINESLMNGIFMPLMNPTPVSDEQKGTHVHINSIKTRVKDPYHFIVKLVRKVSTKTDYASITLDNYHLYFDDLIGFRVILLYLEDWYELHQKLLSRFTYKEDQIVKKQFRSAIPINTKPFMVSKPEINIRNGDDEDIYKLHFRDCSFEKLFDLKKGRYYRSIHYSVFYEGFCFEIQGRSLFDEAWSEVDHDVLYPLYLDNKLLVDFSKQMNRIAGLGNEMASYFRNVLRSSINSQSVDTSHNGTVSVVPDELALENEAFDTNMSETNNLKNDNNSSFSILDNIITGE